MRVRGVSSSRVNSLFEVRPRRASGLVVCSCGNKRGTRESKELVGVAAPSDPVGSFYSENPSSVEGGDVEQVCSNLETNLPCLRLLTLYLLLLSLYLACSYCAYLYMLDILLCSYYYMLGDCLLTLVFNQESQRGTSTHI